MTTDTINTSINTNTNTNTTTINLPCGPITAIQEDTLVYARGIPYGEAQRFEKARAITPWTSARDCTQPATICPQNPSRLNIITGDTVQGRPQSEDCLHITVAAPSLSPSTGNDGEKNSTTTPLPVMVYFHGGGNLTGGGDLMAYDPRPLVRRRHNVVVVTVTSRLSTFGYLPIRILNIPANLGLYDQLTALEWVQTNIATFNGDPKRVTVFGESAGGDTVACLLVCPAARGLFQRAVIQSAPLSRFLDETEDQRAEMTRVVSEHVTQALSRDDILTMPAREWLSLQPFHLKIAKIINDSLMVFAPTFSEPPLDFPQSEFLDRVRQASTEVPVMLGYTSGEGSVFASLDSKGGQGRDEEWWGNTVFVDPARRLHRAMAESCAAAAGAGTFVPALYEFDWKPEHSRWGAAHCMELLFLMGGKDGWPDAPMLEGGDDARDEVERVLDELGAQVKDLWLAFASGQADAQISGKKFVLDKGFKFGS